jgi:pSer/pThr/pTyr-binding forkhead associated (FHA) protein/outer membrane biosynthesis protein TonB
MRRIELQIEHSYKNRVVGRHKIAAGGGLTTLGSSREASIRLLGDAVGPIHAAVEWNNKNWTLSDLGSEHGTWIQKKPVVYQEITDTTIVQIGHHQIKMTPVVTQHELFPENKPSESSKTGDKFHQVIVRRHGLLAVNTLLEPGETFTWHVNGKAQVLPTPKSEEWVTTRTDGIEIRQRLVRAERIRETGKDRLADAFDPNLRGPVALAGLLILLLAGVFFFMPHEPKDTMVALKPEEQNTFTRMIYDAKKIKKVKEESQKFKKQIVAKIEEKKPPSGAAPVKTTQAAARVVNNIKSSGLQALIGKISARAAKNAVIIQAAGGVAPDVAGSGMALGLGRTVGSAAPREVGLGAGSGHKIGSVATNGKGGGSGDYKGFGGLAAGNVGNAAVGILEEETEVDGGLDKEVIARYIKSQLGQIRYCYERQLSANPDLYGKVLVKFTIGGNGAVVTQSVGNSSLNNAMVEGCILRRVAGWQFPSPKGGTQVLVSYPFLFKSTR